jgi:DNA-binding MarR family transcriptional regulator
MDEPRWLTEREDRTWRAYRRMRTMLDLQLARDLARDSRLSEADYDVLSTLSEVDGQRMRLTELADLLLWSRSRLSHHISRMQQRGLVHKEDCADDGRGAYLRLSDAGMLAIESAAPDHVASVRRHLIDQLTPAELDTLGAVAERVVARLTGAPADWADPRNALR